MNAWVPGAVLARTVDVWNTYATPAPRIVAAVPAVGIAAASGPGVRGMAGIVSPPGTALADRAAPAVAGRAAIQLIPAQAVADAYGPQVTVLRFLILDVTAPTARWVVATPAQRWEAA